MMEEINFSASWPVFFASKEADENGERPDDEASSAPSVFEVCRELFGTSFTAPSMIPLIHQQYSSSSQDTEDAMSMRSIPCTGGRSVMDDRRYPHSSSFSVASERRFPLASVSVVSDPTHYHHHHHSDHYASDDASRIDNSSSIYRRRPLALPVHMDPLEDNDGRTVVITPSKRSSPPRFRDYTTRTSPHHSILEPHKFKTLPRTVPEPVPFPLLPEFRAEEESSHRQE